MLGTILQRLSVREEAPAEHGPTDALDAAESDVEGSASEANDGPRASRDDATVQRDAEPVVEWNTLFHTLKNQRRRRVLRLLADRSEPIELGPLAESIAARECDREVDRLGSQERKRVYIALHQCHLPKMDDADAVTYDKSRGRIERGPRFERFERYLPETEDPADGSNGLARVLGPLASVVS